MSVSFSLEIRFKIKKCSMWNIFLFLLSNSNLVIDA